MGKMITVIELTPFLNQIGKCIQPDERDELIDYLARFPNSGDEIPGTSGVRKLRWSGKGKGKRGGLRVIYYFYNETAPVFLFTVYSKGTQEDLTSSQKETFSKLTKAIKAELRGKKHV